MISAADIHWMFLEEQAAAAALLCNESKDKILRRLIEAQERSDI